MDLEALLRAVRDGEPGAWKALHPMLSSELRRFFLREFDESTAFELTQLTMDILTRKLPDFVPRKDSLRKWVFGIARKQGLLEHRARAQDNKALAVLAARVMETPNTSPTERLYGEQLRALLLEEIEKLPSRLRRVIEHDLASTNLATADRLRSLEEFAKREGIQPGTVWSRRFKAIKLLRDQLTARLNPPRLSPRAEDTSSSSSPPA